MFTHRRQPAVRFPPLAARCACQSTVPASRCGPPLQALERSRVRAQAQDIVGLYVDPPPMPWCCRSIEGRRPRRSTAPSPAYPSEKGRGQSNGRSRSILVAALDHIAYGDADVLAVLAGEGLCARRRHGRAGLHSLRRAAGRNSGMAHDRGEVANTLVGVPGTVTVCLLGFSYVAMVCGWASPLPVGANIVSVSGADLRTAVAATVCGLVDDVLDQLRLVAVRGAAVHDLDDDLFARVAARPRLQGFSGMSSCSVSGVRGASVRSGSGNLNSVRLLRSSVAGGA